MGTVTEQQTPGQMSQAGAAAAGTKLRRLQSGVSRAQILATAAPAGSTRLSDTLPPSQVRCLAATCLLHQALGGASSYSQASCSQAALRRLGSHPLPPLPGIFT